MPNENAGSDVTKDRIAAALEDDFPRIVRKDMTIVTELLAKYTCYLRKAAEEEKGELAEQLLDVTVVAMNLRDALDDLVTAQSGAG